MENFDNLYYSENHYTNRWYYLAFSIIYDTEFFGVFTNHSNYDGTLDNDAVIELRDFLCKRQINTLSNIMERKDEIVDFLTNMEE